MTEKSGWSGRDNSVLRTGGGMEEDAEGGGRLLTVPVSMVWRAVLGLPCPQHLAGG